MQAIVTAYPQLLHPVQHLAREFTNVAHAVIPRPKQSLQLVTILLVPKHTVHILHPSIELQQDAQDVLHKQSLMLLT